MRILIFPHDDVSFANDVGRALARLDETQMPARQRVVRLLEELLPQYPAIEIRQQDGLASFETEPNTWYVFRDGSAKR